ncbi:DUF502 domain-containing protein [Natronospira bacteriovora]|uniref:DUF502 domain-containing protein n=1 Tax=Natronospira bacteriovora TaxID=3069753 RepID=A0ABU0W901_9GAMM|nr:DUF502 domain-containing protein [Natronospira sp. AB-CW4]MDQ2070505.1 DUF502 domain-containing protein [Natronospira sp. AB-CW4]
MKRLTKLFFLGLATLLPAVFLLYLMLGLLFWAEHLLGQWLAVWLPAGWYLPGMGLIAGVLLVLLTGVLARSWIGPPVGRCLSRRIGRIPLIGRLYLTVRDVARRFSGERPTGFSAVVFVPESDDPAAGGRLGLVAERQPVACGVAGRALVAVYFPAPFQPGGELLFYPSDRLVDCDMSVDEAMSLILSGGLAAAPEVPAAGQGDNG